ncbi:hypothetical protein BGW38_009180, partial [Lunasporangiospora selenospora]
SVNKQQQQSTSPKDIKDSTKLGLGRRESESKHGSSSTAPITSSSAARRPSQAIKEETPAQESTSASLGVNSSTPAIGKRVSIEDYQRERMSATDKVETPKMNVESPALMPSSAGVMLGKSSSSSSSGSSRDSGAKGSSSLDPKASTGTSSLSSSSSKSSSETSKKISDYYQTFKLRRAEGIAFKHNADDVFKVQNNPRHGAILYFLSAIEFIAGFHANDKYLSLSNQGRPDLFMKESISLWETMRQFICSLTTQCHSNQLAGLDGL